MSLILIALGVIGVFALFGLGYFVVGRSEEEDSQKDENAQ